MAKAMKDARAPVLHELRDMLYEENLRQEQETLSKIEAISERVMAGANGR